MLSIQIRCEEKNFPVFDSGEDFLSDELVVEAGELKSWLDKPDTKNVFWGHGAARKYIVGGWLEQLVFDAIQGDDRSREELREIEGVNNLSHGTIEKAVRRYVFPSVYHYPYLENIEKFCKKEGITLFFGNSCYVLKIDDRVVYIPRTIYKSIENGCREYKYQMLTRVLYCKWYKHFEQKFELDRFKIRDLKVLPLGACDLSDDNCVLVGEFKKFDKFIFLGDRTGREILVDLLFDTIRGDLNVAKSLRDLLLGIYLCGIWDLTDRNIAVERINGSLYFTVIDAEAQAIMGNPLGYGPPWRYPDEESVRNDGIAGLGLLLNTTPRGLRDALLKFVEGENLSCEHMIDIMRKALRPA